MPIRPSVITRGLTTTVTTIIKRRKPRILIAGLGNVLLQDDGVGVHAVRKLREAPPPGVLVAEIGAAVLQGLHLYEWATRILVLDAMQAGGPPGTVYACSATDVADPGIKASLHELSLLGALRFISSNKKPDIQVLGVEPQVIDYGLELTPPVQESLPRFIDLARDTINLWRP
jgi:hydrogenase maturation protease